MTDGHGAMMLAHLSNFRIFFAGLAALVVASDAFSAESPLDSLMYKSPSFPAPQVVEVLHKGQIELWIRALDGPSEEMKCTAAQSIAFAHSRGIKGLEIAIPKLQEVLNRSDTGGTTRLALAQSLITLDAKPSADVLFRQLSSDNPELREIIEPALMKWNFEPIRSVWLERIRLGAPYRRPHLLAIRGLGLARDQKAASLILELVLSPTTPKAVRIEAARAMGKISSTGLEKYAARLVADSTPGGITGILAASLLREHQGEEAVRLLQVLGKNPDSTSSALALARLVEIDAKLVVPILETVLASPDANVRSLGVVALFQHVSDAHIRLLGVRLSDPHPDVRRQARQALSDLAKRSELHALVVAEGTKSLAKSDWQGQEQAAILLAQLDHKPAAKRLLELLRVDRPEAFVAAAWSLRQLAVSETLPSIHEFIGNLNQKMLASGPTGGRGVPPEALDNQLTQLIQLLGQSRYRPADATLRAIVPRFVNPGGKTNPAGIESRVAAAWALGLINEGQSESALVGLLTARLTDINPGPPGMEDDRVRQMAAVSLGRMKARESLPTLRRFYAGKPTLRTINNACGWAIEQITGEVVPPPEMIHRNVVGWFLYPIE